MELATPMNQYNKHCDNWQMRPADIPMDKKLVSSDPKDVAAVDDYKAIALRIAKLLDTSSSVPEQHMIDSIAELVDLEKQLAQVSVLHDDVIKWKHFPRYWTFVHHGIWNHWKLDCFFNIQFRLANIANSKAPHYLCVDSNGTSNAENISTSWRHHYMYMQGVDGAIVPNIAGKLLGKLFICVDNCCICGVSCIFEMLLYEMCYTTYYHYHQFILIYQTPKPNVSRLAFVQSIEAIC